jgi:hypothetical protein
LHSAFAFILQEILYALNCSNLLQLLYTDRFAIAKQTKNLEEAIKLHHEALQLRPPCHPGRAVLCNLAHATREQYTEISFK